MWYGIRIYGAVESKNMEGPFKSCDEVVQHFHAKIDKDCWDKEDDFLLIVNTKTKETEPSKQPGNTPTKKKASSFIDVVKDMTIEERSLLIKEISNIESN